MQEDMVGMMEGRNGPKMVERIEGRNGGRHGRKDGRGHGRRKERLRATILLIALKTRKMRLLGHGTRQ